MFRIPTYVGASPVEGVGVFAARAIPAGTRIWEFTEGVDLRISPEVMDAVPEPLQGVLRKYCYVEEDTLDLILCGDNAKFMNHSFEPNCDDSTGAYTVTLRDIEEGEELTCDYRLFDVESMRDGLIEWRSEDGKAPATSAERG